jgi:hypothetical protein
MGDEGVVALRRMLKGVVERLRVDRGNLDVQVGWEDLL